MIKHWKHNKKSLHLSIASTILWINLCSIIIVTFFNYYVFHHRSAKVYQESFINYNTTLTNLALKNIDQQIIQSVLQLQQLYFSPIQENEPILLPKKHSIRDSSKDIMALAREMQKISRSNPYIAGIDLYYEATNTVVTNFNKIHFPADKQQINRYLPWYKSYQDIYRENKQNPVWTTQKVYLEKEPLLLYINRISGLNQSKDDDIILCAYLKPESFSDYIDQSAGNLFITAGNNQLLYSSDAWEDFSLPDPKASPGIQEIDDFMVSLVSSPTSGLNYYYAMDSTGFYRDYTSVSHILLFSFFLSIVFNVVMLLVITYYNHTTYHNRVHILSKNTGIPIDHSAKSFDRSLNLLEKEILKLSEEADSSRNLNFQAAIRNELLNGASRHPDDSLLPWLTRESCCVTLISLPNADIATMPMEELQEDYPPGQKAYDALFTPVDAQTLAAILLFDNGCFEQVRTDFISEMDSRFKGYRMISGSIAPLVGGGVFCSYQSAAEAARYQYIFTQDRFLSYELLHIDRRKNDGSHLKLFDAVQKDINNTNLLDLQLHLEMLVTSFKSGNYTIDYCQATLRDLVTLLYRSMSQNQLDTWIIFGYDIRSYYKTIKNIDDFQTWCGSICEMIVKQIHQRRQSVDDGLRLKILHLIDEYLEKDITLDLLADKLQIRPNTASRLFRQVIGMGYTDYIKSRKLKRAEELITQGYSVKDTAEKLGYGSAQYFIKVFKENYGMTPHQYKKAKKQENG